MEIIIDGLKDLVKCETKNDSFKEILGEIQKFVFENKRALVSINIDDQFVANQDLDQVNQKTVKSFKTLTIVTCPRNQLSNQTLTEVKKMLPKFKENFEDVAVLVQERKIKTALEKFIKILDEWHQLNEVFLNCVKLSGIDTTQKLTKGMSVESFMQEFNILYNEITESFENEDWVLLADLLEYEISPKIDSLLQLSTSIIKEGKKELQGH